MIPRHMHALSDFLWFIDHPHRRYRMVDDGDARTDEGYPEALRIVRREGGPSVVVPFYAQEFQDSDAHAEDLLIEQLEGAVRLFGRAAR